MTPAQRDKFLLKELLRHCSRMWKMYPGRKAVKYAEKGKFTCQGCGFSRRRPKHPYSKEGKLADRKIAALFEVDHIKPVGRRPKTLKGFMKYLDRKFCAVLNLRRLCKPCHKIKSAEDRKRGWK